MSNSIAKFKGDYYFLSNFYVSNVSIDLDGKTIAGKTVEHVFQASKTLDDDHIEQILSAATPRLAKYFGRHAPLRNDWEAIKVDVMRSIVYDKFTRHPHLKDKLFSTRGLELIEGNYWHDNFWGQCSCNVHKDFGKNWLGRILMDIRDGSEL